ITVAQDGDVEQTQELFRNAAGEELKRESDPVIDNSGNRDHEGQQQQGIGEGADQGSAAGDQQDAEQQNQDGGPLEEQFGSDHPDIPLQHAPQQDGDAPAPGGLQFHGEELFTALPDQERGDHRDEEAVAHVLVIRPLPDQQ